MISKSRFKDYYAKWSSDEQKRLLEIMERLIRENSEYADNKNYGHMCNLITSLAMETALEASAAIWKYCEVNKISGVISALSVPNIVYILRRELDPDKTKEIIDRLLLIFDVAELRAEDLRRAAEMKTADYEDAVKMCCAKRINADFIVTRNIRDFVSSPVPAVKPSELLERI